MNDWNLFEFRFRRSSWRPGLEPIITPSKIPYGEFSQCHFEQGITQRNASREPFLLRHSTSTQRFLALSACQILTIAWRALFNLPSALYAAYL